MRSPTLHIALVTLAGFVSTSAMAAGCVLSAEQAGFLQQNNIVLDVPVGEVRMIQRCDTNEDGVVDINDIRAISLNRNQPAAHPDDPMDFDKNSQIDLLDARGCQALCTEPRCAEASAPPTEPQGVQDVAECFQAQDSDADGEVDQLIGVAENVAGGGSGGARSLAVVFVQKVEGRTNVLRDSYAGKTRGGAVDVHLSRQPAGPVNLGPGTVLLDRPATVSYQDGRPSVLYYVQDGILRRAEFGVDD